MKRKKRKGILVVSDGNQHDWLRKFLRESGYMAVFCAKAEIREAINSHNKRFGHFDAILFDCASSERIVQETVILARIRGQETKIFCFSEITVKEFLSQVSAA